MQGLAHQLIAGIATGGIYASVALALVMIYQSTHHLNFAQGEMATFSTYIALTLIQAGLPYWVAFVLTLVISFGIGVFIERIMLRPMHNASGARECRRLHRAAAGVPQRDGLDVRIHDQGLPLPLRIRHAAARRAGLGA